MELKFIAIALVILNILIYSSLILRIRKGRGEGISQPKKLKLKKIEPVIPTPKSTVTWDESPPPESNVIWDESFEKELDHYWQEEMGKKEKKIEKEDTVEKEKEKIEQENIMVEDEERRVRLLWEGYIRKLDKFIERLEKGNPKKYFDYYREYENLDKFYSRFVFNFGIYLDEIEKNKASGRLGYCSTLLRELLSKV